MIKRNSKEKKIIWTVAGAAIFLIFISCQQNHIGDAEGEKIREYAAELYNRYLFPQAIQQYRHYLDKVSSDKEERANITYRIADIYFDRLHDYENALAEYLKIKTFYPEAAINREIDKKIIACLERLQRPEDARQALSESADLEPSPRESRPGTVLAILGDREITQEDLDFEISQLPLEIRDQFQNKEKKLDFLRRMVATELMYDSAKRQGLDKDQDVLENVFQAKKTFMVQKLLQEQISNRVKIEPQDVELYYKANLDRYQEKDSEGNLIRQIPLAEIQEQVARDLIQERQQQVYEDMINSYIRSENVKIFSDLVK